MSEYSALRRVLAWQQGKPLQRRTSLPIPQADASEVFVTAFLRAGGEQIPWGIAFGHPDQAPTIVTMPNPWDREALAKMVAVWGRALLDHMGEDSDYTARSQLWLPGATHRTMLQLIALAFSWARNGPENRVEHLKTVGRACGFLFRESGRPGQHRVINATSILTECYDIPAEPVRCHHLAFNLAWLLHDGSRGDRMRMAAEAERAAVATAMDPEVEIELNALVQGSGSQGTVESILREELSRRWLLTVQARAFLLARLPENTELAPGLLLSEAEYERQYLSFELSRRRGSTFFPHPSRDTNPRAAASRFFSHGYSDDLMNAHLVHGDTSLLSERIEAGEAFRGTIIRVEDEGEGNRRRPVWYIEAPLSQTLRLRPGKRLELVGLRSRTGRLRAIRNSLDHRIFVVEITGLVTRPRGSSSIPYATDRGALEGQDVAFVPAVPFFLNAQRASQAWDESGPGAWLTKASGAIPGENSNVCQSDLLDIVHSLKGS